jgi:16S rRNA (uracil1498-N3)-methyltransferase
MECLYIPEYSSDQATLSIHGEEYRHCRALRLREGESILVSNGSGLCATATVLSWHKDHVVLQRVEVLPLYRESAKQFHLCIGVLDSKERSEFVVEKAVELGATSITFASTRYASKRRHSMERFRSKAIAALKQCCRAVLPSITLATSLSDAITTIGADHHVICDTNGSTPQSISNNTCIYIGPEGGFNDDEIALLRTLHGVDVWHLGNARLRAETAAMAALSHAAVA